MGATAVSRLELEADLRRAVRRGELRVHFQPIVRLSDGRIVEIEALVRWQHPTRGLVAPASFIPVAEETGMIVELGQWVLSESCQMVRAIQLAYPELPPFSVSVNLSPRQFQHAGLVAEVAEALAESGLEGRYLKLEITEGSLMQDIPAATDTLNQLKALGVELAIDDFGTGYSSLNYLKQFPIDTVKIDRSFVSGITENAQDSGIVAGIVALARHLDLSVTAEGIEDSEQQRRLTALGCDRGQGYLFARPMPYERLLRALHANAHGNRAPAEARSEVRTSG